MEHSQPRPGDHVAHRVDGNALVGVLSTLGAADASVIVLGCGGCGASGPLAGWAVEADRDAFIVRCPTCTHTAATIRREGDGLRIDIAGACSIRSA